MFALAESRIDAGCRVRRGVGDIELADRNRSTRRRSGAPTVAFDVVSEGWNKNAVVPRTVNGQERFFPHDRGLTDNRVGRIREVARGGSRNPHKDHVPIGPCPTTDLRIAGDPLLLRSRAYLAIYFGVGNESTAGPTTVVEDEVAS